VSPNLPDYFAVEQSPNGNNNWTQIATPTSTSYVVSGLSPATIYFFRVRAHNVLGFSGYSNISSATTNASGTHSINYPNGFTGAAASFTFNGYGTSTPIQGSGNLRLSTNGTGNTARSAYFNT